MKLSPPWRKAVLTLHVVTSVGWLGVDLVLLTLGASGFAGWRTEIVYPAMGYVGLVLFVPLSLLVWLIGVFNAWGTKWGLLRWWWVAVKLGLTTAMLGLVWFLLRPNLRAALDLGADLPSATRADLLAAPIVSSTLLIVAAVLSTYKPWGRTKGRPSTVD